MIIVKAPGGRISIAGGGTDTIQFLRKNGHGLCISSAINQYCYVMIKRLLPLHEYSSRITYSEVECVKSNLDIKHDVFRNCIVFSGVQNEPLEINYVSDLKGNLGLGTSSSMVVTLLKALRLYKEYDISRQDLWKHSAYVEQKMIIQTVGYQDYLPTIYGNSYLYKFYCGHGWIEPQYTALSMHNNFTKNINHYGLLIYTGISRNSSSVASGYVHTKDFINKQKKILSLAEEFISKDDYSFDSIGKLLKKSWLIKKEIPGVNNERLDSIYYQCQRLGAYGKLLGSGAGGTFFFMVEPDNRQKVIDACKAFGCVEIPYQISEGGCHRLQ